MEKKLTLRQQKFADEYLKTGNATQSAIKAGYSDKYANSNVSKLLRNTVIKEYIDSRRSKLKEKSEFTLERMLSEYEWMMKVAREDMARSGVRQANTSSFLQSAKEISALLGLSKEQQLRIDKMKRDLESENSEQGNIAGMLRSILNEPND